MFALICINKGFIYWIDKREDQREGILLIIAKVAKHDAGSINQ